MALTYNSQVDSLSDCTKRRSYLAYVKTFIRQIDPLDEQSSWRQYFDSASISWGHSWIWCSGRLFLSFAEQNIFHSKSSSSVHSACRP